MAGVLSAAVGNGLGQSVFRVGAWCFLKPPPQPQPIYEQSPSVWRVRGPERDKLLNLGLNYFIACTTPEAEDALVFMGDSLDAAPSRKDFKSSLAFVPPTQPYFPPGLPSHRYELWRRSRWAELYNTDPAWDDSITAGYQAMYNRHSARIDGVHSFLTAAEGCINQQNKIAGINFMCDNTVVDSYLQLGYVASAPSGCHELTTYEMAKRLVRADHLMTGNYVLYTSTPYSGDAFQTQIDQLVAALRDARRGIRDEPTSIAKFWAVLQTHQAPSYQPPHRYPTKEEILCSVNLSLAYGVKGIVYYVYADAGDYDGHGLLDANRNPTAQYNNVKDINTNYQSTGQSLANIGANFLNLTWKEGFSIHQNLTEPISNGYKLHDVTAKPLGGANDLPESTYVEVGVLQYGSTNHYMIVNRRCASSEIREITIAFQSTTNNAYRVTDVYTGSTTTYYPAGGTTFSYTLTLGPGQGKLLKLEDLGAWSGTIASNTTWSGTIIVNGNITVNSGVTLTVSAGTTVKFASARKLTVNGAITAIGTPTSRITFSRSGASGSWNSIWLASPTGACTFDYCTIQYAQVGIRLYSCSTSVTINHSILSQNQFGFSAQYSSPFTIQNTQVQNNTQSGLWISSKGTSLNVFIKNNLICNNAVHGVYLQQGAIAYFGSDTLRQNTQDGLRAYQNVSAYLCGGNGYNWIHNNTGSGVRGEQQSLPSLGNTWCCGYNHIYDNTLYEVENRNTSGTILAERNYWSASTTDCVYPDNIYGSVDYIPILPTNCEQFASPSGNSVYELELAGQYEEAIAAYRALIARDPNAEEAAFAVGGLVRSHMLSGYGDREIVALLDELIKTYAGKTAAISAKDHSLSYLVRQGDLDEALKRAQELQGRFRNSAREAVYLLEIAFIHELRSARKNGPDLDVAITHYRDLVDRFPESDLAFWAKLQLDDLSGASLGKAYAGGEAPSGENREAPKRFSLHQNYPNPFNLGTEIRYELAENAYVTLEIHNLYGQEVRTLTEGQSEAGRHWVRWDGRDNLGHEVASGVYIYRPVVEPMSNHLERFVQTRKMVLLH